MTGWMSCGTYNKHPSRHTALAVNLATPANAPADQRVHESGKIKSNPVPGVRRLFTIRATAHTTDAGVGLSNQ